MSILDSLTSSLAANSTPYDVADNGSSGYNPGWLGALQSAAGVAYGLLGTSPAKAPGENTGQRVDTPNSPAAPASQPVKASAVAPASTNNLIVIALLAVAGVVVAIFALRK